MKLSLPLITGNILYLLRYNLTHFPMKCPCWTVSGEGVNVYVIDTGVNPTHDDLAGRCDVFFNAIDFGLSDVSFISYRSFFIKMSAGSLLLYFLPFP